MVGAARKLGSGPLSARGLRAAAPEAADVAVWGPPPAVVDEGLRRWVFELQADLQGLVEDVHRGPLERIRRQGRDFLGELRKAFLRHHRRLAVAARTEGAAELGARAEVELGELAMSFRLVVLSRASRAVHDAWSPLELVDAMGRLAEQLPASLRVPVEEATFARTGGSLLERARRRLLLMDRWLRKAGKDEPPQRDVQLASLFRFHFREAEASHLEGLAVLLVEADAHLEGRVGSIFEGIAGAVREVARSAPEDVPEKLNALRGLAEEELALAEEELQRYVGDLERRSRELVAGGCRAAKAELPHLGTYELPSRRREPARSGRLERWRQALVERLEAARAVTAAGYRLRGLRLELSAFQVRARQILEVGVLDLEKSVRGRSKKQIARLRAALDGALALLRGAGEGAEAASPEREPSAKTPERAGELPADADPRSSLDKAVADVRRVLKEAQRAAQQLIDQLTSEQVLSRPLDEAAREARTLTDWYEVPERRLPSAEWTIPKAAPVIDVHFSKVVSTFIETDVAPKLLGTAAQAVSSLQPMLSAFSEVERVAQPGRGQLDGDDALVRDLPEPGETRQVLVPAFERVRDQLLELEEAADGWSRDLSNDLRSAVGDRLEALGGLLSESRIADVAAEDEGEDEEPSKGRLRAGLGSVRGLLDRARTRGTQRVRVAVGEERIAGVRRALGLARAAAPDTRLFEPPAEQVKVPPFYRRLFAGQATWASEVLEEHTGAVGIARQAILQRPQGTLRTVAVLGPDGSGRRALLGAVARGDRFGSARRVAFSAPASVGDVQDALRDLSGEQLVVVTGLSWLVSAAPGGFEPLRALVERVLVNGGRNPFMVEADRLFWQWASSAAPLAEIFPHAIVAPALEPEALGRALLARNRLSGLELGFRGPESEERNRDRYFEALHRASDGLLQIALAYWLASLVEVEEARGRVLVGTLPRSPHEGLRQLPEESFHPLFLVARQGWMTSPVLAGLLGRREPEAQAILARLFGLGLLDRPAQGIYAVRIHLAGALQSVLRERGWV